MTAKSISIYFYICNFFNPRFILYARIWSRKKII